MTPTLTDRPERGTAPDGRRGLPERSPRRSRLWLVLGTILTVPTLLWGGFQVVLMIAHEEVHVTEAVTAEGITAIEVRNPTGTVEIVGADVDEITIDSQVSHGLRRTGHGHRVEGDRLVVWATCPIIGSSWCEATQRIEVPADLAVEVRSAGRLELRSLTGPVEARLGNGSITADRLAGPTILRSTNEDVRVAGHRGEELEVTSSNGDVELELDRPPTRVEARTTNGDVTVAVPPDDEIRYAVDVDARYGDRTNAVISDPGSDRVITARTTNGDATVRYR